MSSLRELRERAYQANMELVQQGLVVYTFGNASAFDPNKGIMAIKPSGVPYSQLSAAKMVLVDMEDKVVEGKLRPSSDTKTHTVLYRRFTGIGGVAHTHSTYASAWAQARRAIPCLGTTHADCAPGEIPVTAPLSKKQVEEDYEKETGEQIVKRFKHFSYRETELVLVSGHGPFSWGVTPEKAIYNSVMLEQLAKSSLLTRLVDPKAVKLDSALLKKHWGRKHGSKRNYGQGK
jgi:L-ribulose-5-phosphate 4-epimerase